MNYFKELRLSFKATARMGAFIRARRSGLSEEQARAHSDQLYPPTDDDIAYEEMLRQQQLELPWRSAVSLLYPIGAMIFLTLYAYLGSKTLPSINEIIGYGFTNLGYLLFAATIFSGKFQILRLKKRSQVFFVALVSFFFGVLIFNISSF